MNLKCLALAVLLSCAVAVHADERLPIPDAKAQQEADKLVKEVFGKEISGATTPDAKLALTKKLLEESTATNTSSEGRYALLKAALGVAPDAKVAMSVIDEMAKQFQIEAMQAKAYTLKNISAITPSERKALAVSAVELADAYIEQDNFEAASALIDIALDAATKSRDSQLIRDVRAKKDDVSSLEEKYADVKLALASLETDPTDPKSNSVLGKYKCFVKGEWEDGLPMLALGDDEALKALATKELMGAKASDAQVALADGWYDLAEKSHEGIKERMLQRAGFWYQAALKSEPELSRLVKAKVEKRLQESANIRKIESLINDGPFASFVGTWTVKYVKLGSGRQYVIDKDGNVTCDTNRATLVSKDEQVFLDFSDGKLERLRLEGDILRVEHFNPKSKFPADPLLGIGMKIAKVDKAVRRVFSDLAGTWTIRYTNNSKRVYLINQSGEVLMNSNKLGKVTLENGDILLDVQDGKIERLHLKNDTLLVEHFNPKSAYPHRITLYGNGKRN